MLWVVVSVGTTILKSLRNFVYCGLGFILLGGNVPFIDFWSQNFISFHDINHHYQIEKSVL